MNGLSNPRDKRLRALIFVVLGIVSCFGMLMEWFGGGSQSPAALKGYQVLAVDSAKASPELDRILAEHGFPGALSAFNAVFALSNYGYSRQVSPSGMTHPLPADDPRLTPWIRYMGTAFADRQGRYSLWYLPASQCDALAPDVSTLGKVLEPILSAKAGLVQGQDWYLLGHNETSPGFLGALCFCLFMTVILVFAPGGRGMLMLLGLACAIQGLRMPLAQTTVMAGAFFVWASVLELLLPACRRFVQDDEQGIFPWDVPGKKAARAASLEALSMYMDTKALIFRLGSYAGFLVLTGVVGCITGSASGTMGLLLVLAAFPVLLVLLYAGLLQARRRKFEHRLFVPVPIISRSNVFHTRMRRAIPWIMGTAIAGLAVSLLGIGSSTVKDVPPGDFPSFKASQFASMVPEDLLVAQWPQGMSPKDGGTGIPDLREFLANQVWQDSLPYLAHGEMGSFSVPALGNRRVLPQYALTDGKLTVQDKEVLVFDENWLKSLMDGKKASGLEAVLLAQGAPGQLVYLPMDRVYSAPDWLLVAYGLTGGFFLVLWFRGKHASNRQWYDVRTSFNQVRKLAV